MATKPSDIEEFYFDQNDLDVFKIEDAKIKLRAVQKQFFPRMEKMVGDAKNLIHEVYDLNPDALMTLSRTPLNHITAKSLVVSNCCNVGLTGQRTHGLLNIKQKNGEPFHFRPSHLWFTINDKCLFVRLSLFATNIDTEFALSVMNLLDVNGETLLSLFNSLLKK